MKVKINADEYWPYYYFCVDGYFSEEIELTEELTEIDFGNIDPSDWSYEEQYNKSLNPTRKHAHFLDADSNIYNAQSRL